MTIVLPWRQISFETFGTKNDNQLPRYVLRIQRYPFQLWCSRRTTDILGNVILPFACKSDHQISQPVSRTLPYPSRFWRVFYIERTARNDFMSWWTQDENCLYGCKVTVWYQNWQLTPQSISRTARYPLRLLRVVKVKRTIMISFAPWLERWFCLDCKYGCEVTIWWFMWQVLPVGCHGILCDWNGTWVTRNGRKVIWIVSDSYESGRGWLFRCFIIVINKVCKLFIKNTVRRNGVIISGKELEIRLARKNYKWKKRAELKKKYT